MNAYCASKSDSARAAIFALLLAAVSLVLHLRFVEYADDDAYIHMRVARNFWLHGEPYFNLGERVMASTSPLWIILTSPFAALGDAQPIAVAVLNALVLVGAAITWSAVYEKLFQSRRSWERAVATLVVFFTLAPASMGLMESSLAMLLVGLGFLGALRGSWWGMPAAITAIFVRPECAVFCVSALAIKCMRRAVCSRSEVITGLAIFISLALFQIFQFGTLYPHTARVKELVYQLNGEEFVRALLVAGYGEWMAKSMLPWVACVVVVLMAWMILQSKGVTRNGLRILSALLSSIFVVFVAPAALIIAVYAVKRVLVFPWYAPLFLVPLHLVFLGFFMAGGLSRRLLAGVLLLPLIFTSLAALAVIVRPACAVSFDAGARARHLRHVGLELAQEFPSAVMMAPEIGALGFEFKGKIVDAVGLASPEALKFHPLKVPEQRPTSAHGGVPAALVVYVRPKLVVGLEGFMLDFLKSNESAAYDIRRTSPVDSDDLIFIPNGRVFGSNALIIAVRRDS